MIGAFLQSPAKAFVQSPAKARVVKVGAYSSINALATQKFWGITPWAPWQYVDYHFDGTDSGGQLGSLLEIYGTAFTYGPYYGLVLSDGAFYKTYSTIESRTPKRYLTRECNLSAVGLKHSEGNNPCEWGGRYTTVPWSAYSKQTIDRYTGTTSYLKVAVTIGGTTTILCDGAKDISSGAWTDPNCLQVLSGQKTIAQITGTEMGVMFATTGPGSANGVLKIDSANSSGSLSATENSTSYIWNAACVFNYLIGSTYYPETDSCGPPLVTDYSGFSASAQFIETWSDPWTQADCMKAAKDALDQAVDLTTNPPQYKTGDGVWHPLAWASGGATLTQINLGWTYQVDGGDGHNYAKDAYTTTPNPIPASGWPWRFIGVSVATNQVVPNTSTPQDSLFMVQRTIERGGNAAIASKMRVWIPISDFNRTNCLYVMPETPPSQNPTTRHPNPPYSSDDGHYGAINAAMCKAYCHQFNSGDVLIPDPQFPVLIPGFDLPFFQAMLFLPYKGWAYKDPPDNLLPFDNGTHTPTQQPNACNWNVIPHSPANTGATTGSTGDEEGSTGD